jgi:hypothetical protein
MFKTGGYKVLKTCKTLETLSIDAKVLLTTKGI